MLSSKEIRQLDKNVLKYALGAPMYCPANHDRIANNIINNNINVNTIIFCLEDAILPQYLSSATKTLERTFELLYTAYKCGKENLPIIFIRVRNPAHLEEVFTKFFKYHEIIMGFVLPKFDTSNSYEYLQVIHKINAYKEFHYLPILESPEIMNVGRVEKMISIRESLLQEDKNILGILVGSNDMSSFYKLRRNVEQTVYDIGAVRNVLVDIVSVFRNYYVINGPIWEFFHGLDGKWEAGLRKEIELDKINGFIGKSCIHPNQVEVVMDAMRVDSAEYEDAIQLLNWSSENGVLKSPRTGRMNEVATNKTWAEEIKILGDIYGIK